MPAILHIDTATENSIISISQNGNTIVSITSNIQKKHASFLQPAIKQLLQESNISIHQLSAVSVTAGPGSYTGLRVGMASAKGLCYALKIPLITLGTLEVMALSVIEHTSIPESYYYCPMIDARRMEVFTALFDDRLNILMPPDAVIVDPLFLHHIKKNTQVIFSGNGAAKFIGLLHDNQNVIFDNTTVSASAMASVSMKKFQNKTFTTITNAEPLYIKKFLTIS